MQKTSHVDVLLRIYYVNVTSLAEHHPQQAPLHVLRDN